MSIRQYQKGDEEQIVELLDLVFKGWPKLDLQHGNQEYWKWLYLDNPTGTNNNIVALEDGQIVGSNLGFFKEVRVNGTKYFSCLSGGLAVHPDYRRKGIYRKMRELKHLRHDEIGTDFSWSITVNPIVIAGAKKRGLEQFPFQLQKMTRIRDIRMHLDHRGESLSMYFLYTLKKLLSNLRYKRGEDSLEIMFVDSVFNDDIEVFWEQVKKKFRFIGERDKKNLNWRYMDPRAGDYQVLVAKEYGKIVGYLVLLINKEHPDYPIGYIVDVLFIENRLDIIEALIDQSLEIFDSNNVNVINYLSVKDYPTQKAFSRKGFFKLKFSSFVEFIPKNEKTKKEAFTDASPSQIHFQYSDIELF